MTTKPKKPKPQLLPTKPEAGVLLIDERYSIEGDKAKFASVDEAGLVAAFFARAISEPEVKAAAIIQEFQGDPLDVNLLVNELREQVAAVEGGSMKRPEAMLVSQAHSLDTLFCTLARRSHANSNAGNTDKAERYLRLALRAQAQAVRTIEALAELKNPRPVTFVRQSNVAHNQQVNNGMPSPAGEIENRQSKLLEAQHGNYVDIDTARAASGANSQLATLGEIDGAKDAGRQSEDLAEC